MATQTLKAAIERQYRMVVHPDRDGGYVVEFPDLPGCLTQIETLDELAESANEARELWITSMFERGMPIPEPTYPEALSGKFNVRLPKSLHRTLVDRAEEEGVSLNQLVVYLLACGAARDRRGMQPALPRQSPRGQADTPDGEGRAAKNKLRLGHLGRRPSLC